MKTRKQQLMVGLFSFFLAINCVHAGLPEPSRCVICGMEIKKDAKIIFESVRDGKPIHFCSFSCVHSFHSKYRDAPVFVYDFNSGKKVNAQSAFFIVKSKNILKELEFGMPPAVVAFLDEASARKVQVRLKDGEVVRGYETLEKMFQ
ncbi:MAG: nitrous oxide reductase accessory protein NosL [Deltaproteobacteria bacterium]|nr:nitrous oxide reductase accessory protein NosL [Deltaproteobacteria bacterium]